MTATEIQKRSERAQQLRVLQTQGNEFYVESAEGKILYRVNMDENHITCTCGDWARNSKSDPNFRCKHIMAVDNCFEHGDFQDAEFIQMRKPKLDERFTTTIEGKDFVIYAGLLDLAHQKGILKIEVDPLQLPTDENRNFAVCKATVTSKMGEVFIDVGDASPSNCSSRVAKHLLRMASTRAIARALRSFTNIGMTCLEELADFSEVAGNGNQSNGTKGKKAPARKPGSKKKTNGEESKTQKIQQQTGEEKTEDQGNTQHAPKVENAENTAQSTTQQGQDEHQDEDTFQGPKMSEAQKRAVYNLSRRRGISVEDLEAMAVERYDTPLENLTSKDASEFIRHLQQAA